MISRCVNGGNYWIPPKGFIDFDYCLCFDLERFDKGVNPFIIKRRDSLYDSTNLEEGDTIEVYEPKKKTENKKPDNLVDDWFQPDFFI